MSKFGTLVLVRKTLSLCVSQTKAVQVGRTVINFQIKELPLPDYVVGDYIKSKKLQTEKDKQEQQLQKVIVNMQQAEDYIKKQSDEHQRLARNGVNRVDDRLDYMRRFQQNIHEEEIKIDPAQIIENQVEPLQAQINRILEMNFLRRQELMNYMENNHPGAVGARFPPLNNNQLEE